MRNRVERLRLWLLAGAGLLVVVLAVFIGSARYLTRQFVRQLPAKLKANIKSESDGPISYSHSVQGRTVYTIHASHQVVYTDDRIGLRDVDMMLYGQKGDRTDRIYGKEFEYDQNAGVVRAIGLIHIDLQASEASGDGEKKGNGSHKPGKSLDSAPKSGGAPRILHATTSGLVYLDKLGVAATNEAIEFELGGMVGHAVGADYNTDSGMLMLHSAVDMVGTAGKRPVTLTAASAELNSREQRAFLTHAKYVSLGDTVTADQATLHARPAGTLERIEAEGNVTSEANGAKLISQRADVLLNEQGEPKSAVLTGGVSYTLNGPLQQRKGQADMLTVAYDAEGRPKRAVFSGAVHLTERTRATEASNEPWSVRDLTAAKVENGLIAVDAHRSELCDAEATGNARLTGVNNGTLASAKGAGRSELIADDLKVHLIASGDSKRPELDTLAGRGHTLLHQVSATGIEQTTTGDVLDAKFRPGAGRVSGVGPGPSQVGMQASETLLSASQQGHVTMMRRVPAKVAAKGGTKPRATDDVEHATAERAAYDGDLDRVTLTGGVQFSDAGSVVWANKLALDHKTGDAQAEGAVKVNYVKDDSSQSGAAHAGAPAEPTHILADRADLKHTTSVATFYGKPVRMWQGGNQVQAPVIELAREEKRLVARSEAGSGAQTGQVRTVLVKAEADKTRTAKAGASKTGPGKTGAKAGAGSPSVARITSSGLMYSGVANLAEFTGGVRVESADGTMTAHEATVSLQSANAAASADAKGAEVAPVSLKGGTSSNNSESEFLLDGRVERVVATGQVEIEQPGSRATGERLVYTASDELYVLTGDDNTAPRFVDLVRKTTVEDAAAIRFHVGDQSVEFLSAVPGEKGSGKRVRTDTPVNNAKKLGNETKPGSAAH